MPPERTAQSVVYFLQCVMPDGRGPIKIGYMGNGEMWRRIKELQGGCPWDLVAIRITPGDKANERWAHEKFRQLRMRGEWFRFSAELVEFALSLPQAPWAERPAGSVHKPRAEVVSLAARRATR